MLTLRRCRGASVLLLSAFWAQYNSYNLNLQLLLSDWFTPDRSLSRAGTPWGLGFETMRDWFGPHASPRVTIIIDTRSITRLLSLRVMLKQAPLRKRSERAGRRLGDPHLYRVRGGLRLRRIRGREKCLYRQPATRNRSPFSSAAGLLPRSYPHRKTRKKCAINRFTVVGALGAVALWGTSRQGEYMLYAQTHRTHIGVASGIPLWMTGTAVGMAAGASATSGGNHSTAPPLTMDLSPHVASHPGCLVSNQPCKRGVTEREAAVSGVLNAMRVAVVCFDAQWPRQRSKHMAETVSLYSP